jgi:hypothetical protein
MGWEVDGLRATVADLKPRGLVFEAGHPGR